VEERERRKEDRKNKREREKERRKGAKRQPRSFKQTRERVCVCGENKAPLCILVRRLFAAPQRKQKKREKTETEKKRGKRVCANCFIPEFTYLGM
jgi:hypothetical protein